MYSLLHAQMIRTQQEQIAARAIHRRDVQDVCAVAASHRGRARRRAVNAVAVLGVCMAAATGVAVSDASARQSAAQHIRVSATQLQREITALRSVGFVESSCQVGGTRMTNYSTNQSVLIPW